MTYAHTEIEKLSVCVGKCWKILYLFNNRKRLLINTAPELFLFQCDEITVGSSDSHHC